MVNEGILNTDLIRRYKKYWDKVIYKEYNKIILNHVSMENKLNVNKKKVRLNSNVYNKLIKVSKNDNLMIYIIILSVFRIAISRCFESTEFFIGVPQYLKSSYMKSNNKFILLDNDYIEDNTFKEALIIERKEILEAYNNQLYPMKELYRAINIYKKVNLYCCMRNIHSLDQIQDILNLNNNELTLIVEKYDDCIELEFSYCDEVISDEVSRIINIFINIITAAIENIEIKLKDIEILSEEEKHKLLVEFNDTSTDYPRDKTIQELFEHQVKREPNNVAVVFQNSKLTYKELNERANALARILREKGVESDVIVGIMMERSIEMIVGIMAILKAGGAYLPIDPSYPKDRIKYMLNDSGSKLLVSNRKLLSEVKIEIESIDILNEELLERDRSNLEIVNTSNNLAYVIYTSGSTGKPKGVMIEHRNILNTLTWWNNYHNFDRNDVVLQIMAYSFDGSVGDIFASLISGARLILVNHNKLLNIEYLKETITREKVTSLLITPAFYNTLLEDGLNGISTLTKIAVAGESLQYKIVEKHFDRFPEIMLVNEYGPTENSICSTVYKFTNGKKRVLIGAPINNTRIYILNKENKLLPIGVAGELCISGDGLARGYLDNEKLTAEKFIENPYEPGQKMYKTGDLAKWMPDGNIEFLGRIDHQVKIRGFRIELGEIESALLKIEGIKETVVLDKDKEGNKYLCAYYVSNVEYSIGEFREKLRKFLPDYMIPSYFIKIEAIPLTTNGKIDKKSLPEPEEDINTGAKYEAPRNEIEEKLVEIWQDVLGVNSIGINDNFFELGGHSLKATTLVGRIHKELNVEVPLKEIFRVENIKGLSEYILFIDKKEYEAIEKVEEREYYETSSAQKRMYMLQEFDKGSTAYNMFGALEITGELDVERIRETFIKLIERHEVLRTSFFVKDDTVLQKVHSLNEVEFSIKRIEVQGEEEVEEKIKEFVKIFNFEKVPLLRVAVIRLKEDRHIMLFDMHHIACDGTSMSILTNELNQLYAGKELKELKIQYKDYSAWQLKKRENEEFKKQEEYWLKEFRGEIPVLNIPADYTRPKVKDFKGDSISFTLDSETTNGLRRIAKENESTIYMLLLANFKILLSKYSGQEDIVIGSPIAGRNHRDLEDIIGMFVNTLAIRSTVDSELSFKEYLKAIKEKALKAYENQDYQFEELVEKLDVDRDPSRNPLFDVMFVLQNMKEAKIEMEDLVFKPYATRNNTEKFDITVTAGEGNNEIYFNLSYATSIYKHETMERMVNHFLNIVKEIIKNTEVKLKDIEILNEEEKHNLLLEFNNTAIDYPRNKTIHELFEEQVEKTPNNIAVVFENKKLSYRELNEKANILARNLRGRGVKLDSIVGILMKRSIDMIVGVLGILKAGGAYLPISIEYPEDRVLSMLNDSNAKIVITNEEELDNLELKNIFTDSKLLVVLADKLEKEGYENQCENLETISKPDSLLYVIYTSGSTGNPKGVMLEHKNMVNLVKYEYDKTNIDFSKKVLQFANMCFDVCYQELFSTLLCGGELNIISEENKKDINKLITLIEDKNISVVFLPTAYMKFISSDKEYIENFPRTLDHIIVAGEQLIVNEDLKEYIKGSNVKLHNHYGPSETHVVTTITLDGSKEIFSIPSIGKPVSNTKIYILNKDMKIQPIGVKGEIYISGESVGRGYINLEELNKDKFVDNPYEPNQRMYKTGDLGRWLPDGNIEYLGRKDNQVKIRGFRIELGEIESALSKIEGIKETVVLDKDKEGSKYLCAYYVSNIEYSIGELREKLKKFLPDYMIPSYFIKLENMPLTSNGKVDRRALPEAEGEINIGAEYEAPRNEIEERLVEIWRDILGVSGIGINSNFFELGGHSIKLVTLATKISKEMAMNISVEDLFNNPTIKGIYNIMNSSLSKVENTMTRLSYNGDKNIFSFPPAVGYGFCYILLTKLINTHSLYAFNYIDDINFIDKYTKKITNIQKNEPFILLGYSLGGRLAFEVAKDLENKGYEISDIIMLDSFVSQSFNFELLDASRDEAINGIKNYLKPLISDVNQEDQAKMQERIIKTYDEYLEFARKNITKGKVNSNIHIIMSSNESNLNELLKWKEHTLKDVVIYNGYGEHNDMLLSEYVEKNADIIKLILSKISND